MKTTKQLLEDNKDPCVALLAYRSTLLENGYSQSQLLMGRKLRTTLPITLRQLKFSVPKERVVREKERKLKKRNNKNFDRQHKARDLQPLQPGDTVWVPENQSDGTVVEQWSEDTSPSESGTRKTRSGRVSRPPVRLEQNWT